MDYLKVIDTIFESINTDKIDGDSRMAYLLFLFIQLRELNFSMVNLDEKTTLHITKKFTTKLINEHLSQLQETFIFMEVRQAASIMLDKEPKSKNQKFEPEEVKSELKKVEVVEDNYNPESDVLDEEGYMEPPPKREMQYDVEFLKTLGIDK